MPAAVTQYCDWPSVQKKLSAAGANLRVDDDPTAPEDVLDEAAVKVNEYCERFYSIAALANSNWVRFKARTIAAYLACTRRGNPAPQSIADEYAEALKMLEKALSGTFIIPDAPQRSAAIPVLSVQRVRQFPVSEIKTVSGLSTGTPTGYTQHNDDLTDRGIDYSI